ncbi:MAG: hypothetical protein LIO65_07050 [Odoribacter sp.]|nr:hypothetical protein [Odoribacter sp.]
MWFLGILYSLHLMAAEEDILYFSGLSLKDGLSQMSVLEICQDTRGFMWFGTRNGLNKFDGENFTVYRHINNDSTSISDNHITALLEDSNGNLWVGTVNGLNRINLRNDEIRTYYQKNASLSLTDNYILSLYEDHKNRLWVGTVNGISLYIPEYETFQRIDLNGILNNEKVNIITQDEENRFLIGTASKGLLVCSEEMRYIKCFDTSTSTPLSGNSVNAIYQDSRKQIWVGTQFDGINRINIDTEEIVTYSKK